MNTVSYKFHTEKVARLENKMLLQRVGMFFLILASIYLGYQVYDARHSEAVTQERIQAFKNNNQKQLDIWTTERRDFIKHYEFKGRLRKMDAKKVAYYDSKIEQMKGHNQTLNLLKVRLSYP
ncbi:MAG: hypothetical protein JKY03_05410 [Aureispira sp.]|nr:hypothetical protein [Aureispira sp.]